MPSPHPSRSRAIAPNPVRKLEDRTLTGATMGSSPVSLRTSLAVLTLALPAVAQSFAVSPPQCYINEGSTLASEPFSMISRYQQITGDLTGTPRLIQALMFRRDGIQHPDTSYIARTIDCEIVCADSSYAAASSNFASNLLNPVVVSTRKLFNLPDLGAWANRMPSPDTIVLPFDSGYAYTGRLDIAYELKTFAVSSSNGYPVDAVSLRDTALTGQFISLGGGCLTANGVMRLRSIFTTHSTNATTTLDWSVSSGPSTTTGGLLVGLTNPNVFDPMLCPHIGGNWLKSDGVLVSLVGSIDALGNWTIPTMTIPFTPSMVGATVSSQAVAVDLSQQGFGVAVSNGLSSKVPPGPSAFQIKRVMALGTGATSATTGTLAPGLGFVTRYN